MMNSDDNTWEPEDNLDCPELIGAYEEARIKREAAEQLPEVKKKDGRGRWRREKKIEKKEIEKPRGLARQLSPEKVLAAQLLAGNLYFLIKWHGCDEFDVVLSRDLRNAYPDFLIEYYERHRPWSHPVSRLGRVPREAPELGVSSETLAEESQPMETGQETEQTPSDVGLDETLGMDQDASEQSQHIQQAVEEAIQTLETPSESELGNMEMDMPLMDASDDSHIQVPVN